MAAGKQSPTTPTKLIHSLDISRLLGPARNEKLKKLTLCEIGFTYHNVVE